VTTVSCAVEGDLDEAIARRLLDHCALDAGAVYGRMGKSHLRESIHGYAFAARRGPWFVMVDLDEEAACAGELVAAWLPDPPTLLKLRVAVREAEAWLLGDRANLARFLNVSRDLIPRNPDAVSDPKAMLVGIASRSRTRATREGLPPREGSGRSIGPLYVAELARFVRSPWDVDAAAAESVSLARCLRALADPR
jgi:hypothetical protein